MRHVRTAVWGVVGLMSCGVLAFVGAREQHSTSEVRLQAGSAWVASNRPGHLTLLDGAAKEVAARVPLTAPGTELGVAQQNATAFAVSRTNGALYRVDGATLEISGSPAPLPDAALSVFPTSTALLAFDAKHGRVAGLDPRTLRRHDEPQELRPADADRTAVDASGALWVVDDKSGDLVWFRDGKRHVRDEAGSRGATRLVTTGGAIALIDAERRTASLLDADGNVTKEIALTLQPGDEIKVSGLPAKPGVVVSVGSRGEVLTCRFNDRCADSRKLGTAALGPAVVTAGHTFVPDYTRGHVWILRDGASEPLDRGLFDGPVKFELFERDGVVFYNDPESERAGVIDPDGQVHPISKYDPVDPDKGTIEVPEENPHTPPLEGPQPPGTNQPPNPSRPPVPGHPTTGPGLPEQVRIEQSPPNPVRVGEQVSFQLAGAAAVTASWDFGDGITGSGTDIAHTFSRSGTFPVSAVAPLASGRTVSVSTTVVVETESAAIVRLQITPAVPLTGSPVSFSAETTGTPQAWQWTITSGGGVIRESTEDHFGHTFTMPGTYTLSARMTSDSVVYERSQQFTVGLPVKSFQCGETVDASAQLAGDMSCSGTALSVSSRDVYLDLGGHTVSNANPQENSVVVQNADNVIVANGNVGTVRLINTDNVQVNNVQGFLPGLSQARNTRFTGGRFGGPFNGAITASQVTFTGVTISTSAALTCEGASQCEFVDSTLTINGSGGSALSCNGNLNSVISITGGRGTINSLGCVGTLIVADVTNLTTTTIDGGTVDIRRSTLHPDEGGIRGRRIHVEGNTFSDTNKAGFWSVNQGFMNETTTGVIRNNTFTRMRSAGIYLNYRGPVNSLLVENNTITGNATNIAQFQDWCGNRGVHGGMHICVWNQDGTGITLRGNTMSNNNRRALFVDRGTLVRNYGGNTSGGEECIPATMCEP